MTTDSAIAHAREAGWFVESLHERRGGRVWPHGPWLAVLRDRTGERHGTASGRTAAEALAAALQDATASPPDPDLEELLL